MSSERKRAFYCSYCCPAVLLLERLLTGHFPLVVFVQGAAWGEQEKYRNIPQLVQVAREGFVVASVKHRAATVAKFPAFLQDIKAAIRFLRAHAKEYYIDPEQVAIWGDS